MNKVKDNDTLFFSTTNFRDMKLTNDTIDVLSNQSFEIATEVQAKCIPIAKKGKDIMSTAKTGSGKTLAFLIPALELLIRAEYAQSQGVGVLIITPTRELALQIYEVASGLLKPCHKTPGVIIGGGYRKKEAAKLIKGVNLLIATPGRLLDHLKNTEGFLFDNLAMLIIDEADTILKDGFEDEMKEILTILPKDRQTMLFSATLNQDVENLNTLSLNDPVYIKIEHRNDIPTIEKLDQGYVIVPAELKFMFLYTFLKKNCNKKVMVFFSSCREVEFYNILLLNNGIEVIQIQGDLVQKEREKKYDTFFKMKKGVLLCTNVAQRGLDFPEVDWVIQYDSPLSCDDYLHRVGRTARGPNGEGKALLILIDNELAFIEELKIRNVSKYTRLYLYINIDSFKRV